MVKQNSSGSQSEASASKPSAKSNIRIHSKNLVCPQCLQTTFHFVHREYLLDMSQGLKCRHCGEQIPEAILESATSELTPEEVEKFIPKGSA